MSKNKRIVGSNSCHERMALRVVITPAVDPHLFEVCYFYIQSTGQISHCVYTSECVHNMFVIKIVDVECNKHNKQHREHTNSNNDNMKRRT